MVSTLVGQRFIQSGGSIEALTRSGRLRWYASLAAMAALSGCSAGADDPGSGAFAADDMARLEGTVVDDALVPVVGAEVILDGLVRAVAGDVGEFAFDVEPGVHEIVAVKEGYAAATVSLEVSAGELRRFAVTLVPSAIAEAYHETRIQSGQIGCSTGYRANSANTSYFAACALGSLVTNTTQIDNPFLNWNVGSAWRDVAGFWGETTWRSSQALGTGMTTDWFVLDVAFGGTASYKIQSIGKTEGRSPLAVRLPMELLRNATSDQATGVGPICPESEAERDCWLLSGHYASARTTNQAVDVAVTIQQRYTDFLTIFFGPVFPETFSAVPEQ